MNPSKEKFIYAQKEGTINRIKKLSAALHLLMCESSTIFQELTDLLERNNMMIGLSKRYANGVLYNSDMFFREFSKMIKDDVSKMNVFKDIDIFDKKFRDFTGTQTGFLPFPKDKLVDDGTVTGDWLVNKIKEIYDNEKLIFFGWMNEDEFNRILTVESVRRVNKCMKIISSNYNIDINKIYDIIKQKTPDNENVVYLDVAAAYVRDKIIDWCNEIRSRSFPGVNENDNVADEEAKE